jgi:hypothetical protein
MAELKSIQIVYADWCPHCVPTAVEPLKERAEMLRIPCILYHVDDPNASKKADELVRKRGDWSEDYLIPQVFLEYDNGNVIHVFTGYSEDIELTKKGLNNLLSGPMLK